MLPEIEVLLESCRRNYLFLLNHSHHFFAHKCSGCGFKVFKSKHMLRSPLGKSVIPFFPTPFRYLPYLINSMQNDLLGNECLLIIALFCFYTNEFIIMATESKDNTNAVITLLSCSYT